MGGETTTSKAGDAKVSKPSQSRADAWKGKAVVGSPPSNPQKKRSVDASSSALSTKHQLTHSKTKSAPSSSKSEVKSRTTTSSSKIYAKTATIRARSEKKVYTLPGQKHDPPEEREPLRIFYESLLKQKPTSEMAEVWMMEHGLLSPERAKKAYDRKQKRQQQQKTGTPTKSTKMERLPTPQKLQPSKSIDLKTKKRIQYSDSDDDFLVKLKKARG